MLPDTILRLANDEEFQWLLQPELKAIKDGLVYVEDKDCVYLWRSGKYRGYLNAQGQRQGVGIIITKYFDKFLGEWHEDKLHGIAKEEQYDGESWWGHFKLGSREGYITHTNRYGIVNYFQYKNGQRNGYGIQKIIGQSVKRGLYQGEFNDVGRDGYGLMKFNNTDEYDGQWKDDR
jgi:hypothetical protein